MRIIFLLDSRALFRRKPLLMGTLILAAAVAAVLSSAPRAFAEPTVSVEPPPPDLPGVRFSAHAPRDMPLNIGVTLALRDRDKLERDNEARANPFSPLYGKAVTKEEWERYFAPRKQDVDGVVQWLKKQGFKFTGGTPRLGGLDFEATVDEAERAFQVQIMTTPEGKLYANDDRPKVPARFAGVITYVMGLSNAEAGIGPPVHYAPGGLLVPAPGADPEGSGGAPIARDSIPG